MAENFCVSDALLGRKLHKTGVFGKLAPGIKPATFGVHGGRADLPFDGGLDFPFVN